MAVTLDTTLGTGKAHTATTVSVVTTNAVAAGGMIALLAARFVNGTDTMSVTTTGGLTWSTAHNVASGNIRIYLFYAFAPSGLASSTTLTVTSSGANADLMATACSFLGVSSTVTAFNGSGATGTAWTSGSLTAGSGDAMIGGSFEDGSGVATSTPSAPAVEWADFNDATQTEALTAIYKLSVAGTDTTAGTWSTSVTHVDIGAAFAAAAAAAAIAVPVLTTPPFRHSRKRW